VLGPRIGELAAAAGEDRLRWMPAKLGRNRLMQTVKSGIDRLV